MWLSSACVEAEEQGSVLSSSGFFSGKSPTLAASCPEDQGEYRSPPRTNAQGSRLLKGPVLLGRG